MNRHLAPNLGWRFLAEVDRYLEENLSNLACADIRDMYFQFFEDLKEFKGNSAGFTGLSEYLVFRSLYHRLGGSFERKQVSGSEGYRFVSRSSRELWIGQGLRVIAGESRHYPDVVVCQFTQLIAVAEVKIFLSAGARGLKQEMKKLERLRDHHPVMQALLIHYNKLSENGTLLPLFRQMKADRPWFDFVDLEGRNEPFGEVLHKGLGLERIKA